MSTKEKQDSQPTLDPLTVEKLKTLKFGLRCHVNGGSSYSIRTVGNDEYGLSMTTETNGSPHYLITGKTLSADGADHVTLDMRTQSPDYEAFCAAYNEWKFPSTQP